MRVQSLCVMFGQKVKQETRKRRRTEREECACHSMPKSIKMGFMAGEGFVHPRGEKEEEETEVVNFPKLPKREKRGRHSLQDPNRVNSHRTMTWMAACRLCHGVFYAWCPHYFGFFCSPHSNMEPTSSSPKTPYTSSKWKSCIDGP